MASPVDRIEELLNAELMMIPEIRDIHERTKECFRRIINDDTNLSGIRNLVPLAKAGIHMLSFETEFLTRLSAPVTEEVRLNLKQFDRSVTGALRSVLCVLKVFNLDNKKRSSNHEKALVDPLIDVYRNWKGLETRLSAIASELHEARVVYEAPEWTEEHIVTFESIREDATSECNKLLEALRRAREVVQTIPGKRGNDASKVINTMIRDVTTGQARFSNVALIEATNDSITFERIHLLEIIRSMSGSVRTMSQSLEPVSRVLDPEQTNAWKRLGVRTGLLLKRLTQCRKTLAAWRSPRGISVAPLSPSTIEAVDEVDVVAGGRVEHAEANLARTRMKMRDAWSSQSPRERMIMEWFLSDGNPEVMELMGITNSEGVVEIDNETIQELQRIGIPRSQVERVLGQDSRFEITNRSGKPSGGLRQIEAPPNTMDALLAQLDVGRPGSRRRSGAVPKKG